MTFDDCLAPVTAKQFLTDYAGRSWLHLSGTAERWQNLITLAEIADVATRLIVYPGMLRLMHGSGEVPPERYLSWPISYQQNTRSVKMAALARYLEDGATLIIEHAEGLFPRVHAMCGTLSAGFCAQIRATAFLVLKDDRPVALHWDDHDVFVCQALGSKRWPVYQPIVAKPLRSNTRGELETPTLAWEGTLAAGDALYLPRGWPHQPSAVSSPSLHVTFDISRPTGSDLLKSITDAVLRSECARNDLPLLSSRADRLRFNQTLRDLVASQMSDEALEAYYTAQRLFLAADTAREQASLARQLHLGDPA